MPLSDSSLSVSANSANNLKKPALSSVPTVVQSNGLLLGTNGDGSGLALSSTEVSVNETSKGGKKVKASEKPAVPPKPLKKKVKLTECVACFKKIVYFMPKNV